MTLNRKPRPGYLALLRTGELRARADAARELLHRCELCPRHCGVDRLEGQRGFCGAGAQVKVARALPHMGEEPPLSGARGAGTIFFSHCNMRCLFCQNRQISHEGLGEETTPAGLARTMLALQEQRCHNLELVSPSHYLPHILDALHIAALGGLRIPIVYNTNGYECPRTMQLLDGVVDVYLPDIKYGDDAIASELSEVDDYVALNRTAIREMFRQVGLLNCDSSGIARRGVIVRHLVLPANLAQTRDCLGFLSRQVSSDVQVSLMAQYNPLYGAAGHRLLGRRLTRVEYDDAVECALDLGLQNCWVQEIESADSCVPDFVKPDPFDFGSKKQASP